MPLQTFRNLPESRQNEIRKVCFEEFALNEYHVASLGNIIRKLGIAKGSFYRYFEHKKDLYFYLVDQAFQIQFDTVDNLFSDIDIDLPDMIAEVFTRKIRFDMENPLISGFLYNVMQEKNNEELGNIQLETKKRMVERIGDYLLAQVKQYKLRADTPVHDMAFLIVQVQLGLPDYFAIKYEIDFRELIKTGKPDRPIHEEDLQQDVRSFARLMQSGMQKSIIMPY